MRSSFHSISGLCPTRSFGLSSTASGLTPKPNPVLTPNRQTLGPSYFTPNLHFPRSSHRSQSASPGYRLKSRRGGGQSGNPSLWLLIGQRFGDVRSREGFPQQTPRPRLSLRAGGPAPQPLALCPRRRASERQALPRAVAGGSRARRRALSQPQGDEGLAGEEAVSESSYSFHAREQKRFVITGPDPFSSALTSLFQPRPASEGLRCAVTLRPFLHSSKLLILDVFPQVFISSSIFKQAGNVARLLY